MGEFTELPKSDTQLAEERMAAVERQIHAHVPQGVRRQLRCPYCGTLNMHQTGKLMCCDLLRKAVIAVLVADRLENTLKAAERHGNN